MKEDFFAKERKKFLLFPFPNGRGIKSEAWELELMRASSQQNHLLTTGDTFHLCASNSNEEDGICFKWHRDCFPLQSPIPTTMQKIYHAFF